MIKKEEHGISAMYLAYKQIIIAINTNKQN